MTNSIMRLGGLRLRQLSRQMFDLRHRLQCPRMMLHSALYAGIIYPPGCRNLLHTPLSFSKPDPLRLALYISDCIYLLIRRIRIFFTHSILPPMPHHAAPVHLTPWCGHVTPPLPPHATGWARHAAPAAPQAAPPASERPRAARAAAVVTC